MPGHLRHTLPKNLGIFKQHEPIVLGNFDDGLQWTEGPLWLDSRLIFSDPKEELNLGRHADEQRPALRRLRENAGGCQRPTSALSDRVVLNRHEESLRLKHNFYCFADQLEPGPNGHALENSTNGYPTGLLVEAQHARAASFAATALPLRSSTCLRARTAAFRSIAPMTLRSIR